uniref:YjbQ n=1 Tax=Anopheles dirus TaxID=7168 RepID=A0A182MZH3_9DIPT
GHFRREEVVELPLVAQNSPKGAGRVRNAYRTEILHTSASLALNESWDPDVRDDMEMMLNKIVPEGLPYRHSCEGPDDMPAHVKACFLGSSLTIPITDGKLSLGTWQGVWLCEHRDHAGSRKLVITLSGCPRDSARSPLSPVSPIASTSS